MTAHKLVNLASSYAGISQAELARKLNMSPQLLNNRLKTGKFSLEEWERIAAALGASLSVEFVFPDGGTIRNQ